MQIKSHFFWTKIVILFAALVVAFFWSFFVGRYELTMQEVVDILWLQNHGPSRDTGRTLWRLS